MKVAITEDCAGTGQCVGVAPGIFELNKDGLATVVLQPETEAQIDAARTAAELCPMAAIQIEDD